MIILYSFPWSDGSEGMTEDDMRGNSYLGETYYDSVELAKQAAQRYTDEALARMNLPSSPLEWIPQGEERLFAYGASPFDESWEIWL